MPCDSSESHAAHIDLHRLFTACQTLNISATVKKVARGGEGNTEEERKMWVRKWLIVKYCEFEKVRWGKLLNEQKLKRERRRRKRRGNQKGCCKRTHVLPGDLYPKEILWSLLCLCVCVGMCVCVNSRWCLYELSQLIYDGSPLTVTEMENMLTTQCFSVQLTFKFLRWSVCLHTQNEQIASSLVSIHTLKNSLDKYTNKTVHLKRRVLATRYSWWWAI